MPWPCLSRSAVAALAGTVVAGVVVGAPHPADAVAQPVPDRASGPVSVTGKSPAGAAALRPVAPAITRHRVATADAKTSAAGAPRGPVVTLSPSYAVSGYATVGLTWDAAAVLGRTTLQVRLLDDGTWSGWSLLEHEVDHAPDAGSVEAAGTIAGTEPLLVGDVDRVQVKVTSQRTAPRGLTLAAIDPGDSTADSTLATAAPKISTDSATLAAASTGVPRPAIYTRAQWGADESLRSGTPRFGSVQTTFIHHTVNANDYSATEVPAILRSIYAYHTQVRGWSDIGYNVLVDRFGKLWEGRYGGLEGNVIGAHTLNYNEDAFGVSAIGNFEETQPPTAMLDALASVVAWKLDLAGLPATGSTQVDGTSFQMINGHRDAASTACPGTYLYAKLSVIRQKAAALVAAGDQAAPVVLGLRRAADADTRPDVVVREHGALRSMLGDAGPGFLRRAGRGSVAGRLDTVTGVGDVDGDGSGDVLVRHRSDGTFQVRGADGEGGLSVVVTDGGQRFAAATALVGAPDLTGDGRHDVIVRMPSGNVRVATGQTGGFGSSRLVSTDWGSHRAVLGAGDLDADGIGDLLLVDTRGVLWAVHGQGDLAFGAPVRLSRGWDTRRHMVAGVDLTGDGRPDLMATDVADGLTWIRPGTSSGAFGVPIGGWAGWTAARILAATADATGDGFPDAVVVDSDGGMTVRASRHGMWLRPGNTTEGDWSAYRWLRLVGDWNGDGRGDLAGVEGDLLWIFHGRGNGTFRARTGGWPGWSGTGQLVAVDDWNGDGLPDLVSRPRDGSLWLHRGRGPDGAAAPVLLRSADPELASVMPVGLWNDDQLPDLLARGSDGALHLLPGLARRRLGNPVALTDDGLGGYDRLIGAGDLTGDGRPDLLARTKRTGTVFILPGSLTGVGSRVRVAGGWRQYTMIG